VGTDELYTQVASILEFFLFQRHLWSLEPASGAARIIEHDRSVTNHLSLNELLCSCRIQFGSVLQVMFRLVSAYSLSQNTIESAETS
jgi:hypothetical protein